MTKTKRLSLLDNLSRILFGIALAIVAFAWYDHTFNPLMTYMCRYYIGEHPTGGDAFLDSGTLDHVTACRLDQRRYRQEFQPIRTCTDEDIEYGRSHPRNGPFCLAR